MTKQNPCLKVRLIKPNGEIAFNDDFGTSGRALSAERLNFQYSSRGTAPTSRSVLVL
jgi:hypothetical protein